MFVQVLNRSSLDLVGFVKVEGNKIATSVRDSMIKLLMKMSASTLKPFFLKGEQIWVTSSELVGMPI